MLSDILLFYASRVLLCTFLLFWLYYSTLYLAEK